MCHELHGTKSPACLRSSSVKQTDAFIEQTAGLVEKPSIVMYDRDTKFTNTFVAMMNEMESSLGITEHVCHGYASFYTSRGHE